MQEITITTNKQLSAKDEAEFIKLVQDFLKGKEDPAEELRRRVLNKLATYYETEFHGIDFNDFMACFSAFTFPIQQGVVYGLLMKTAAMLLDRNYKEPINDNDTVYFISKLDGRMGSVRYGDILNKQTVAFFRTVEDAKLAICAFKDRYDAIFAKENRENSK